MDRRIHVCIGGGRHSRLIFNLLCIITAFHQDDHQSNHPQWPPRRHAGLQDQPRNERVRTQNRKSIYTSPPRCQGWERAVLYLFQDRHPPPSPRLHRTAYKGADKELVLGKLEDRDEVFLSGWEFKYGGEGGEDRSTGDEHCTTGKETVGFHAMLVRSCEDVGARAMTTM